MKLLETISQGTKIAGKFILDNSPTILTAIGIGGMITAVVMATKQPVDIQEELYELEKEEEQKAKQTGELAHPFMPRLKIYAKHYWPTGVVLIFSGGCFICANHINLSRQAALLALTASQSTKIKDIRNKIVELDGKKKLERVDESLAEDYVRRNPPPQHAGSFKKDGYWILDYPSGRYMWGDCEQVKRGIDEINRRMVAGEHDLEVNELYDEWTHQGLICEGSIEVPHTGDGNLLGFIFDSTDDLIRPTISYCGYGGELGAPPVMVIDYEKKALPWKHY